MSGTLNKVMIIGYLGRDPEIKAGQDGKQRALLSVATSERWKDRQSGEPKEKTEWHRVVVFNEGAVTFAQRYVRKGSKVFVEGQLQTRAWEGSDGVKRQATEILVPAFSGRLSLMDKVESDSERDHEPAAQAARASKSDDEIPF